MNEDTPDLHQQLAQLGRLSQTHLHAAEKALVQTQDILTNAITQLNASFLSLHAVLLAQDAALRQGDGPEAEGKHTQDRADGWHKEGAAQVSKAVTALQFQDISSQLLHDSQHRIAGVRQLLEAALPGNLPGTDAEVPGLQQTLAAALAYQGARLEAMRAAPIADSSNDGGGIELF